MIETPPFIKALLKDATEAELAEATENVARYLAAVMRIYERLRMQETSDSLESPPSGRVEGT